MKTSAGDPPDPSAVRGSSFEASTTPADLGSCEQPPEEVFDVALLDLDGVLYVGSEAVPHAAAAIAAAQRAGMRREYVTNNALRPPAEVAAALCELGINATAEQVVTSAQAAAHVLAARLPAGAAVLVTGGRGLRQAVAEAGLTVVDSADDHPAGVVLGYDPTLDYGRLTQAALAVRAGAFFVAANRDATVPSPRGPLPGMGAITAFVVAAADVEPVVAGKPEYALHAESIRRSGARRPLVVGDRLDTDIEGARRAGTPSLLVLTGVTELITLAAAPAHRRPDLVAPDLRGLQQAHPPVTDGACGRAHATYDRGRVQLARPGSAVESLRALVTVAWTALDAGHRIDHVDQVDCAETADGLVSGDEDGRGVTGRQSEQDA